LIAVESNRSSSALTAKIDSFVGGKRKEAIGTQGKNAAEKETVKFDSDLV